MMFAMALLAGCTGDKKETKEEVAGKEAVVSFVEAVNRATEDVRSSTSLVDPQTAMSKAVTPQIIREINLNKECKIDDNERELLQEAMDNFFSTVSAQYDTIPGTEAMNDLLNQMKAIVDTRIKETKKLGDLFSNQKIDA